MLMVLRSSPFPAATALLFFTVTLSRVLRHEPWRDEVGVWLHVLDAASFPDLLSGLDWGGHPVLWPLLLVPLAAVFDDPLAMQLLHVLIATASVYIVMRFAPFPLAIKLLLCFGYYLGYEYAVISRQYALIVLFLVSLLAYRDRHRDNLVVPAILMFGMAESSVHGLILAAAMGAALVVGRQQQRFYSAFQLRWGLGILLAGLTIAVIDIVPPAGYGFGPEWHTYFDADRLRAVVELIASAYLPLRVHPWGPRYLDPGSLPVTFTLSVAIAVAAPFVLRRNRAALVFLALSGVGLLLFFYLKYFGFLRHHGFIFIAIVGAFWLALSDDSECKGLRRSVQLILYPALLFQVASCAWMSYLDWRLPFSGAQAAAEFIQARGLDGMPKAGHGAHQMSGIALALGEPIYLLQMEQESRMVIWDSRFRHRLTRDEIAARAQARANELGQPMLLILSHPFQRSAAGSHFGFIQKVPKFAIVRTEEFYLFRVMPERRS